MCVPAFLFSSLIPALLSFTAVLDSERGNVFLFRSSSFLSPSRLAWIKHTTHTHTHLCVAFVCVLTCFMFHSKGSVCVFAWLYFIWFSHTHIHTEYRVSKSFPLCPFRDFAYVARDKDTRILKCHVFRCDTPAKAIATSLHEICSRVRSFFFFFPFPP